LANPNLSRFATEEGRSGKADLRRVDERLNLSADTSEICLGVAARAPGR
jgi:hypothetical protein